jgi:integrase
MARLPSLNHQMFQRLEDKKAIGKSRHLAKMDARENGGKVETIHSYKTYDAYKQSSKTFVKWLRQEFPEVKDVNDIDKDIGAMYIKYREKIGCSAYTYSQDIAMLNKTLSLGLNKAYCGVANRSIDKITKGRTSNGFKTDSMALETIIKASGVRRNELYNLKKSDLLIHDSKVLGVQVIAGAKGGRPRTIEVIGKYQEAFYKLVESIESDSKIVTDKIPKQLQTHRLRAEFAQEKYEELVELGRKDPLQDLTQSMGHNRTSVLVHYGVKVKK